MGDTTKIFRIPTPDNSLHVDQIYSIDGSTDMFLPLLLVPVPAGTPLWGEDYIEGSIDLNKHLAPNPASTFVVHVVGDSMLEAGIHEGDMLIVDRSETAANDDIVVAVLNGCITVKRLQSTRNRVVLLPDNPKYQPIEISPNDAFSIWGVVRGLHRSL